MAEWYEQLLSLQLRTNREIWVALQEHAAGDAELRLGFRYLAPGEAEARSLVAFLGEETDYDIEARPDDNDPAENGDGSWLVIGTTQPTPVSLELLDSWVEWMIAAGAVEGPCAFDGWAAQLVSG